MYNALYIVPTDGSTTVKLVIGERTLKKLPWSSAEIILRFVDTFGSKGCLSRLEYSEFALGCATAIAIQIKDDLTHIVDDLSEFFPGCGVEFLRKAHIGEEK